MLSIFRKIFLIVLISSNIAFAGDSFKVEPAEKNVAYGDEVPVSMLINSPAGYSLAGWNANIVRKESPEFLDNTILKINPHSSYRDYDSVDVAPYNHLSIPVIKGKVDYVIETDRLAPGRIQINFVGRFLNAAGEVKYEGQHIVLNIAPPAVPEGKPGTIGNYTICFSPDAPPSVRTAVSEIQRYILRTTGVCLPIVKKYKSPAIVVGETPETLKAGIDPDSFEFNEYLLKTVDNDLFICGRDIDGDGKTPMGGHSFGTLRGAYIFLDEVLGVHFLQSGKLGEDIPDLGADWQLPAVDRRGRPFFKAVCLFPVPKCGDDFLTRNGYFGPIGNEMPYSSTHSWNELYPPASKNHPYLKSREATYADNPEFFEMANNGKRVMPPPGELFSLCLSAPGIFDDIAGRIKLISQNTGVKIYPISPNDCAPSCRCPGCRAGIEPKSEKDTGPLALDINGSSSPIVLDYYRKICEAVARFDPEFRLTGYIYNTSEFAPSKRPAPMPANFIADMAPLHTDYGPVRLDDDINASWHKWKNEWDGLLGEKFYYGLGFWLRQSSGAPVSPMPGLMKETFDYLRDNNFIGVLFYPNEGLGHSGLYLWVLLKMIDDPSRSPSELMDQYLKYAYGEAAGKKIRRIYDLSEAYMKQYYTKRNGRGGYEMSTVMLEEIYAPIFVEMEQIYFEAEKLADTPARRWRLSLLGENLKLLRYQLTALGMIAADESSPLYMDDAGYMQLALRTKGDLKSYVDPPTETTQAAVWRPIASVKRDRVPEHLKRKIKPERIDFKFHADFLIYAPEDMTVDMHLRYDVPESPDYGKDIAYYTVYDRNGTAFYYAIGRKGHLTFPAKKGEFYYLVYTPQGQGFFDPGWRVKSCNAPFAAGYGTYLVSGGKIFSGKGSFYCKLTEKTPKLEFFIHGYPCTVKFVDPSGKVVKTVKSGGFEHPVIDNPARGWWRIDYEVPAWIGYIRSPQMNGYFFTDPDNVLDIRMK